MANKLDRIEKDIQKVKSKIAEYNKQLRELEGQKTEQENLQIIQLVRGMNMTREEFAAFLRGGALQTAPTLTPYHEKEDTGMRNKIITRFLSVILAVGLSAAMFTTTAFAGGGDEEGEVIPTEPTGEEASTPAPKPLTPEGNMSLVDDIDGEASEDKQFITVVSKTGNYFYIIIDRAGDGENTVHFLNQVDEADLLALMEAEEEPPAVCTCSVKCEAGAVNTACPVCANNLTACAGKAPEPQEPEEPEPPAKENKGGMGGLLVLLIVALAGGGGALYYFKLRKPKADVSGSSDLSEYDFDDEDEPEGEEMEDEE